MVNLFSKSFINISQSSRGTTFYPSAFADILPLGAHAQSSRKDLSYSSRGARAAFAANFPTRPCA